jgi:WD40 repeat protein
MKTVLLSFLLISINSYCQLSDSIPLQEILVNYKQCVISKDASLLVFAGDKFCSPSYYLSEIVVLFDLDKKKKVSSCEYDFKYVPYKVAISDDNSKIACCLWANGLADKMLYRIVIWDRYSGKIISEKKTDMFSNILSFSPDSKYLAFDKADLVLQVIDASNGKNYDKIDLDIIDSRIYASGRYLLSPDWKYIALISNDNTIAIWDVKNKTIEKNINCKDCLIKEISYSQDGKNILCYADKSIKIFDMKNGNLIFEKQRPEHTRSNYFKLSSTFAINKSNNLIFYQIITENRNENNYYDKFTYNTYYYSLIKNSVVESISGDFYDAFFSNNDDKLILVNNYEIRIYNISKFTNERQIIAYDKAIEGTIIDCNTYLSMFPNGDYVLDVKNEMIKKEKVAYDKAIIGTIADCNSYLTMFPNGDFVVAVKNEMIKKEKIAYDKAINGSVYDCNSYISEFPNGKYVSDVEALKIEKILYKGAKEGNIADCNNYLSKYPNGKYISEVKSKITEVENDAYEKAKRGNVTDCNNYITQFSNGKYVNEVNQLKNEKVAYNKAAIGGINECNIYLSNYPAGQYATEVRQMITLRQQEARNAEENATYEKAKNGNISDCNNYIAKYPNGKYSNEVNQFKLKRQQELRDAEEKTAFEKAKSGSIYDCNNYLAKYPNGKYTSQVNTYKQNKQDEINRENQLAIYSNKSNWKMGNKLCNKTSSGIICGTLNQWNEDKSMVQISIVTSPGGTYQGESLKKGNLIWVATSGKGWHICFEDEISQSLQNDKSQVEPVPVYKDESQKNTCGLKVGIKVYNCSYYNGFGYFNKGYELVSATVEQIAEDRIKIKIISVSDDYLKFYDGEDVYVGKEMWISCYGWYTTIPKECQ